MRELHRKINHDLCTAVDLTKLGVAIDSLIAAGMPGTKGYQYRSMAHALLTLLREENDRLNAPKSSTSISCACERAVPGMWTSGYDDDPKTAGSRVRHDALACAIYMPTGQNVPVR